MTVGQKEFEVGKFYKREYMDGTSFIFVALRSVEDSCYEDNRQEILIVDGDGAGDITPFLYHEDYKEYEMPKVIEKMFARLLGDYIGGYHDIEEAMDDLKSKIG